MTLPAAMSTTLTWPDWANSEAGPFAASSALYTVGVDRTNNKIRCMRSADGGHTWAEQDAANAPASATAATFRQFHCVQSGTTLYVFNVLSSSSMQIKPFDCAANTWSAAITGPTITINSFAAETATQLHGIRRSDGSFVIAYNGATESVMGTAYSRLKLHIRSAAGTWTGPFDVSGSANSPIANTLPGTQLHVEYRSMTLGASDRIVLVYLNRASTATTCSQWVRVLTSADAFAAAGAEITAIQTSRYASEYGYPTTYVDGANTMIAAPYFEFSESPATGGAVKVARCNTATAETPANWTTETAITFVPSGAGVSENRNRLIMLSDSSTSKKLWLWHVRYPADSIEYTHDAGAAAWHEVSTWKGQLGVSIRGINAERITNGIGLCYVDRYGVPAVTQELFDGDHQIGFSDTSSQHQIAQKIRFATTRTVKAAAVLARRVGSDGGNIVTIRFETDNAGAPSGTLIGTGTTGSLSMVQGFDGLTWCSFHVFAPSNCVLLANTDYWMRFDAGPNSATDYWAIGTYSGDGYPNGDVVIGTSAPVWTPVTGTDLAFRLFTLEDSPDRYLYDRLDVYTPKASVAVGSTSTLIYLGDTPPETYDVLTDIGDNADPAGTVTIYVDGGWDDGALNPIAVDGPNPVQAENSLTVNSPPSYLRVTTVVETAASVIGVAGT